MSYKGLEEALAKCAAKRSTSIESHDAEKLEEALGLKHTWTPNTVNNLGLLYAGQAELYCNRRPFCQRLHISFYFIR